MKKDKKSMINEVEYCYVPMWSPVAKYDNHTLYEIISAIDSELKREEDIRYELYYGDIALRGLTDNMIEYNKKYEEKITKLYEEKGLPENLILVQDETGLHELVTGLPIDSNNLYLNIKKITKDKLSEIKDANPNYIRNVKRLFYFYERSKNLDENEDVKSLIKNK